VRSWHHNRYSSHNGPNDPLFPGAFHFLLVPIACQRMGSVHDRSKSLHSVYTDETTNWCSYDGVERISAGALEWRLTTQFHRDGVISGQCSLHAMASVGPPENCQKAFEMNTFCHLPGTRRLFPPEIHVSDLRNFMCTLVVPYPFHDVRRQDRSLKSLESSLNESTCWMAYS
jgi:hypothetical protein